MTQSSSTGNVAEVMLSQEKPIKKADMNMIPKLTLTQSEQYALKQEEMLMPVPKGKDPAPSISGETISNPGFMLIPKIADKKNGSAWF